MSPSVLCACRDNRTGSFKFCIFIRAGGREEEEEGRGVVPNLNCYLYRGGDFSESIAECKKPWSVLLSRALHGMHAALLLMFFLWILRPAAHNVGKIFVCAGRKHGSGVSVWVCARRNMAGFTDRNAIRDYEVKDLFLYNCCFSFFLKRTYFFFFFSSYIESFL